MQRRFLVTAPWQRLLLAWNPKCSVEFNHLGGPFFSLHFGPPRAPPSVPKTSQDPNFSKRALHLGPQAAPSVPKTFISTLGSEYCKPQHQGSPHTKSIGKALPSSPPSVLSIVSPNIKGSPHTKSIGKALLSVMPMTQNLFSNGGNCLDPRICSTLGKCWRQMVGLELGNFGNGWNYIPPCLVWSMLEKMILLI